MKIFEEAIETMEAEELRHYLKIYLKLEDRLKKELGEETYLDIVHEVAFNDSVDMLVKWGIPKEQIEEFKKLFEKEKPIN